MNGIKIDFQDEKLDISLDKKLERIKKIASDSSDLLINEVKISGIKTALICCEGMLSTSTVTELVLVPLTKLGNTESFDTAEGRLGDIEGSMGVSVDRTKADY